MGDVAVYKVEKCLYPKWEDGFFRPSIRYPEYLWTDEDIASKGNEVYDAVRECFHLLGFDDEHWNTPSWNPLGGIIRPGDNILIKPNLVMEANGIPENGTECLYSQPSVVAAVIDYVILAGGPNCRIVVGDAPMQTCKWDILIQQSHYADLIEWYQKRNINISLVDFRELSSERVNGVVVQHEKETGKGRIINLGAESEFAGLDQKAYDSLRITSYDPDELKKHHNSAVQEYDLSQYLLDADVVINMPKPKTHRKAGVTIALKNMIGVNVRKEYLPHHTLASVEEGGDEYLKKDSFRKTQAALWDRMNHASAHGRYFQSWFFHQLSRVFSLLLRMKKTAYAEGSWYGNHTISRTIADINKLVLFADKNGVLRNTPQRKTLVVADMIISGEKDGPLCPSPKKVGLIAAGTDFLPFDKAIAGLMGFDVSRIPAIVNAENAHGKLSLAEADVSSAFRSNIREIDGLSPEQACRTYHLDYEAASGWKGHIERAG